MIDRSATRSAIQVPISKRTVLFDRAHATFARFEQAFEDVFERRHEPDLKSLVTDRFHRIGQADAGISSP